MGFIHGQERFRNSRSITKGDNMENNIEAVNAFLDNLIGLKSLKNDAALARTLGIHQPVISRTRKGKLPFGDAMKIKVLRSFPIFTLEKLELELSRVPSSQPESIAA